MDAFDHGYGDLVCAGVFDDFRFSFPGSGEGDWLWENDKEVLCQDLAGSFAIWDSFLLYGVDSGGEDVPDRYVVGRTLDGAYHAQLVPSVVFVSDIGFVCSDACSQMGVKTVALLGDCVGAGLFFSGEQWTAFPQSICGRGSIPGAAGWIYLCVLLCIRILPAQKGEESGGEPYAGVGRWDSDRAG